MTLRLHFLLPALAGVFPFASLAAEVEFNREIRPILAENCFGCHGPDPGARKAEMRLDTEAGFFDGKDGNPPVVIRGEPEQSELYRRISTADPDDHMPPPKSHKTLTAEEIGLIRNWIQEGAQWQSHWSLIPPTRPAPPEVKRTEWARTPIDRFVLATLEQMGLSPASAADPRTLVRRLSLDLTGLPPAPEVVEAFAANPTEEAYQELIDTLLASPRYGEHRARYWLDAARYGDTHGMHFDNYREMWPYRDWVVRAFNQNLPFDQFTVWQLAGDLLPDPTLDQLVATGFQRCNITTNEGGTIEAENLANYAVDRVQTMGWVYMGLTTNCAQCHDHKFDPITTKDYYSLAAFFRNTTQGALDGNSKDGRGPVTMVPTAEDRPRWEALPGMIADAASKRDARRVEAGPQFEQWLATATPEHLDESLPTEGLAVHVPLNEGAGNEVASVCGGQPVLFKSSGEVAWDPNGKTGPAPKMEKGTTFDLGNHGDYDLKQPFSYGAWVKAGRNGVFGAILARMEVEKAYRGWDLWQNDQQFGAHFVDAWPDNSMKVITERPVLKPGEWQHVFVTYDGSGTPDGVRLYLDGTEQAKKIENNTFKPDATIRTTTPLRIGQRSNDQIFSGGLVQDVRIYERQLNAGEVKAIADSGPLPAILAAAGEQRTPEQRQALLDHFFLSRDTQYPALAKAVSDLESESETIRVRSPITHIQVEKDSKPSAQILMRGQYDKPGEEVAAATPAALPPLPEDAPRNRLGLAQWVVAPSNPLTARVTVNRLWQQLFGQGIVVTAEDFGIMGSPPSDPELLDWLAVEFRESGWDVKRLLKLIVSSATYRQSAVLTPEKLEQDRDNRFLSRGPRFRMDAEMVRDYALAASGLLSEKMGGPGVRPYQPEGIWDVVGLPGGDTRNYVQDQGENLYRRTLYNFWKRMAPPPSLDAFNAPSREVCTVRRERTNTPLQALVTMNDPQFVEAARHLAQLALQSAGDDDAKALDLIAHRALARPLETHEVAILTASLTDLRAFYSAHPEDAKALLTVGESKADESLDPAQLAAWTMVCNQVLNLDEVLNK